MSIRILERLFCYASPGSHEGIDNAHQGANVPFKAIWRVAWCNFGSVELETKN